MAVSVAIGRWLGTFRGLTAHAFFNTRGFTGALTQIIELRTADMTATLHGDLFNTRRMEQEDTLDADALEDSADCDCFAKSTTAPLDNDAFITLGSFFAAFFNLDKYL